MLEFYARLRIRQPGAGSPRQAGRRRWRQRDLDRDRDFDREPAFDRDRERDDVRDRDDRERDCEELFLPALRRRVAAALRAAAERADFGRDAEALPPVRPPLRAGAFDVRLPRPEPLFFPPPDILFSVAQARRAASFRGTPCSS
jgi:hypothetical protein